jgi:anti-sigma-K factor RskA
MRLFNFDDPSHRNAIVLLPWYVNGTLEGVERARVEQHVQECVACRGELEAQRSLLEAVRTDAPSPALSAALARMHARLDQQPVRAQAQHNAVAVESGWLRPRWLAWVAMAEAACIAGLLVVPRLDDAPGYHTLSAPPTGSAPVDAVVVVFDGAMPQAEMQSLLRAMDARIVDGPNTRGAYTLGVPAGRGGEVLHILQREPSVLFVQPAPQSQMPRS